MRTAYFVNIEALGEERKFNWWKLLFDVLLFLDNKYIYNGTEFNSVNVSRIQVSLPLSPIKSNQGEEDLVVDLRSSNESINLFIRETFDSKNPRRVD